MLDAGGPIFVSALAAGAGDSCGHGVSLHTRPGANDGEVTLLLRPAQQLEDGSAYGEGEKEPAAVTLSLATGSFVPTDQRAEAFLATRPWLGEVLRERLEWLRERSRRADEQRDREAACFARLARAEPGNMVPHDELFPADWDLLFDHEARLHWAIPHYCVNPTCTCAEIFIELHDVAEARAKLVGELRIDFNTTRLAPEASSAYAAKLFKPLWDRHGAEVLLRHGEVRRAVARLAAHGETARAANSPEPTRLRRLGRNDPCHCASGKKYKRCCADRDAVNARLNATSPSAAR
jgi:hypothetical protein